MKNETQNVSPLLHNSIHSTFFKLIRSRSFHLSWLAVVLCIVLVWQPATAHFQAGSLLLNVIGKPLPHLLSDSVNHSVDESLVSFPSPSDPSKTIRARLYSPRETPQRSGMVLVHGVHHLGLDEPRLMLFARSISATGVTVLTPEVTELADFNVSPKCIETIGAATQFLREKLGNQKRVGLMGLSFAGGLALMTAADPQFKSNISFVVAVGAHHDLARVSRFFAVNDIERPDGSHEKLQAHPYGPLVVVYSHLEKFFPKNDLPVARETLKLWLCEQLDEARKRAENLSPAARSKMVNLFDQKIDLVKDEILDEIKRSEPEMEQVSPKGHLKTLDVPVFLLHGAGDTVIPATETLWLEKEIPASLPRKVLVSHLIGHVELNDQTSWYETWELVHFLAGILSETH